MSVWWKSDLCTRRLQLQGISSTGLCYIRIWSCYSLLGFGFVCRGGKVQAIKVLQIQIHAPFVVCKFVAVVIPGDNVHEQNVLGFRVKACDLHLVAGKHPPRGHTQEKKLKRFGGEKKITKKERDGVPRAPYCDVHLSYFVPKELLGQNDDL